MDITGHDIVIFTAQTHAEIIRRFAAGLRGRWPKAIVDVAFDPMRIEWQGKDWSFLDDLLPDVARRPRVEVFFVRDRAMQIHMEKRGYAPDHTGAGPLMLAVLTRPGLQLEAPTLIERRAPDRARLGEIDPYPAWVCGPALQEVTLVTSDDPQQNHFAAWAHQLALDACSSG